MRQTTGLILGQWLSIPFIIWGIWLIVNALRRPAEVVVTLSSPICFNRNNNQNQSQK